jgi:hypothetical protein
MRLSSLGGLDFLPLRYPELRGIFAGINMRHGNFMNPHSSASISGSTDFAALNHSNFRIKIKRRNSLPEYFQIFLSGIVFWGGADS